MTLRLRLILAIVGIATLSMLPAVHAVRQLARLSEIVGLARNQHARAYLALGRLDTQLADLERLERSYVATPGEAMLRENRDRALVGARVEIGRLSESGYNDSALPLQGRLDRIEHEVSAVDSLLGQGARYAATDRLTGSLIPLLDAAQRALDGVSEDIDLRSEMDLIKARQISDRALVTTVVVMILGVILAVLLGTLAAARLTGPVAGLRQAMAIVAMGEFEVPEDLPYRRSDEIGDVARSFRSMTQRLSDLDRIKAEFMSIATHELKTPINVICGYADLIGEGIYGEVTAGQQKALDSIREQSQALTQLVNQLLDISRLEAGGLRIERHGIDLPELLRNVERSFQVLARRKGIQFAVAIDASIPRTVPADADRLRDQVLGNLLSNALKFTPEGGRIGLAAASADGRVTIEVSDTGPGIPEEQLSFIFDKFFQVGQEARGKGAGLGLAIAREVVESHGGEISAHNNPDGGATFRVTLPLEQPAPSEPMPEAVPATAGVAS